MTIKSPLSENESKMLEKSDHEGIRDALIKYPNRLTLADQGRYQKILTSAAKAEGEKDPEDWVSPLGC
jgi:hypothetical protein